MALRTSGSWNRPLAKAQFFFFAEVPSDVWRFSPNWYFLLPRGLRTSHIFRHLALAYSLRFHPCIRISIRKEDKMNTKALLSVVVISGVLTLPHAAFSRDESDYNRRTDWYDSWKDSDVRPLQGRWYMNGDPNKPTEIHMNGRRLEATNENGQTTRLERDGRGDIRASDWQGVRGDVRGNRIEWSNGSTWTRRPSDRMGNGGWNDRDARQLQGRWYVNGDPKKLAEINADGGNLQARNENGQTSRLEVDRTGNVRAPDWRLRGDLRGNRIEWANGTAWTKNPSERLSRR